MTSYRLSIKMTYLKVHIMFSVMPLLCIFQVLYNYFNSVKWSVTH